MTGGTGAGISGLTINNGTQVATFTLNPGSANATLTIHDGTDSATNTIAVSSVKLLFYDNFIRANTSLGGAGSTNCGMGWIDVAGSTGKILSDALDLVAGNYNANPMSRPTQETPLASRVIARVPMDGPGNTAAVRVRDNGQGDFLYAYLTSNQFHVTGQSAIGGIGDNYAGVTTTGSPIIQLDSVVSGSSVSCIANIYASSAYIDQASCSVLASMGGSAATPLGTATLGTIAGYPGLLIPCFAGIAPLTGGQTCTEFLVADTSPPSNQYDYAAGSALSMRRARDLLQHAFRRHRHVVFGGGQSFGRRNLYRVALDNSHAFVNRHDPGRHGLGDHPDRCRAPLR